MKKAIFLAAGLSAAAIYLGGCGAQEAETASPAEAPAASADVLPASADIKQLTADIGAGRAAAKSASITSSLLTVTSGGGTETEYKLPENEFFLSVAPYLNHTHLCAVHNLAGCRGELKEQEFRVTVVGSDGTAVMEDAAVKSGVNGFIDLWLPREDTYRITIGQGDKSAETQVSTYDGDDTCLTTMQLG
ncbi:CueP family metal-binding protein [Saccharibacillus sp. CPCC 101409]|uniref:CueP family metal-binding protein n=1 Tax=Saccharibacillus sp. CPCC 101409 TaxID=3058041 RepID=UPI0026739840|nr:CueP family metal-binding protein [Saccharibacillus sp. CPCC 101409]MDO3410391.1 CueP family metal-binding protein [Saccharibacillus sp. CPCC 101409]